MFPLFSSASRSTKSISIDGETIEFRIWDTAGQEKVITYLCYLLFFQLGGGDSLAAIAAAMEVE